MMSMKTLAYFVVLCSFLVNYGIECIQFSKQEELQWVKQYKLLKKPSVKTIKSEYGDVYDCVDFYKQPAFDHPLMKNHSSHPQMRPSFVPEWIKDKTFYLKDEALVNSMQFEDGGCPVGTIPIRRWSKDEFIQMKRFTEDYASRSKPKDIQLKSGTHFAIVQTKSDPSKVNYYGVRCDLNVYDPYVTPQQYTSGEMIIQNGDDRIQVGWTVNPAINKDNRARLFQYFSAGRSHCFNLLCPGFVSMNKDFPIDMAFDKVSRRGERIQWCTGPFVYQDPKTGHWWFLVKDSVRPDNIVGYWPREIFTSLARSATYIAVGGEVYGPPDQRLPPMGNGYYPTEDGSKSAYCSRMEVLDANHQKINPQQTERYSNNWHYGVYDRQQYFDKGRTIFFGGTTMDFKEKEGS